MALPLQHYGCEVLEGFSLGFSDLYQIVLQGCFDVDQSFGQGSDRDLVHINKRTGVEHGVPGCDGHGGD